MSIIKELSTSFQNVMDTFFGSDTDLMSTKVKHIMSVPSDRQKYLEALAQLKEMEKNGAHGTKTITLSTQEKLTLTV